MPNTDLEQVVFGKKTLGDLAKEIYEKKNKRDKILDDCIQKLDELIQNVQDAVVLAPIVKDYIKTSVENEGIMVKMMDILQRILKKVQEADEGILTAEEKRQLMAEIKLVEKEAKKPTASA